MESDKNKFSFLKKRKGKVLLCTIHGRTTIDGVDIQLFAVGKPKGKTYMRWWIHDPGLAPSKELITFTKLNNRKGHKQGWFKRYTESLLNEWSIREDFSKSFSRLIKWLNEGKVVAIACYCAPQKRSQCHLSILKDLIEDFGYEVTEAEPV